MESREKRPENKNLVVYGIFQSREGAERAVDELRSAGFRPADVSALFSSPETSKEFAVTKETKAPEGATVGGTSGALVGGTLGWLVGAGALTIPGIGIFVAAGPIMSLLAGAGVGGVVGGLTGALVGTGLPEYEASRYDGLLKKGGVLLSVHADNKEWQKKAKTLLENIGAEDISCIEEADASYSTDETPRAYNF